VEEDAIQREVRDERWARESNEKKRTYPINCDPRAIAILSLK